MCDTPMGGEDFEAGQAVVECNRPWRLVGSISTPTAELGDDPGGPGERFGEVGIFLSCWRDTAGAYAMQAIVNEWKAGGEVKDELVGTAKLSKTARGTLDTIIDSLQVESLEQPEVIKRRFPGSPSG